MKKEVTTIKISKDLVSRICNLKVHPRQAYEEVIMKLLVEYKPREGVTYSVGKREITTIKISKEVLRKLSSLKVHPRQAYEEVIFMLLEGRNG